MPRPVVGVAPSIRYRPGRGDAYVLYANYAAMVSRGGGLPFLLPLAATREEALELIDRVDGLLLTGGNDIDPALYGQAARPATAVAPRARIESDLLLARAAQERGRPALGVCLGIQVMNVAFGGTLLQHIPEDVPGALRHEEQNRAGPEHPVRIVPGTLLARALGVETAVVNSYHHQAIAKTAPGFHVSARSPDGIVEGIERDDHPFYLGIQWHPERMLDSGITQRLLHAFMDSARTSRKP